MWLSIIASYVWAFHGLSKESHPQVGSYVKCLWMLFSGESSPDRTERVALKMWWSLKCFKKVSRLTCVKSYMGIVRLIDNLWFSIWYWSLRARQAWALSMSRPQQEFATFTFQLEFICLAEFFSPHKCLSDHIKDVCTASFMLWIFLVNSIARSENEKLTFISLKMANKKGSIFACVRIHLTAKSKKI